MKRYCQCTPEWITTRGSARCAEANCQTPITPGDAALYFHAENGLYGSRCGHGRKAEREVAAHCLYRRSTAAPNSQWVALTALLVLAALLLGVLLGNQLNPPSEDAADWTAAIQDSL